MRGGATRGRSFVEAERGRAGCLGVACTEDGLFLGGTALIERRQSCYAVRPQADLDRLVGRACQGGIAVERLIPGLHRIAAALAENNLCLAQIGALHLSLPDLPDRLARRNLEAEDLLIKRARACDPLVRGYNPAEHPRAGVPPDPGWNLHTPAEICIDSFQADRAPDRRYRTAPIGKLFTHVKGGFYHDGRFKTLAGVVDHYNICMKLGLTKGEKNDLIQYLLSLTFGAQAH